MSARTRISDRTLLASCLARLFEIPHAHQVLMHQDQMISLAHRDHFPVPFAEGGTNHFSNVWARLITEHREKTAKTDIPAIAKGKRIRSREIVRRYKAIQKCDPTAAAELYPAVERLLQRRKRKIANRGFSKRHRPLRSQNNLRRRS